MSEANDWNHNVIEEFRANEGKVGGPFAHLPLVLVHHKGAKTGTPRINPLAYRRDGSNYVIFASYAGAPESPDWFHNLVANPETEIETGTAILPVKVRVAEGEERERLWEAQKAEYPLFAEYEEKTDREIPVVVLEPRA
jgi:deazaflavin-dependent oxidoreductase (nitroreductase family)